MLVVISESDITKTRNPAAAELDHFLLRKKVGTRTVLAEIPVFLVFVKHVLMDSDITTSTALHQLKATDLLDNGNIRGPGGEFRLCPIRPCLSLQSVPGLSARTVRVRIFT